MIQLNTIISGNMSGFEPTASTDSIRPEDMTDAQLLTAFRTINDITRLGGHIFVWRTRHGLSQHWYPEEVVEHALNGTVPPRASNGVWVRSALRETRKLMTLRESTAWVRGEIELPTGVSQAQACSNIRTLLAGTHGDVVYQWSEAEVFAYVHDGTMPVRSARGSFVNSPLRDIRPVSQWQDNEIVDAIEGLINLPANVTQGDLYAEARKRWGLPPAWTNEQIKDYLLNELEPPKNEDGIWIVDPTRKDKPFSEWSDAELIAWVRGEIELEGRLRPSGAYREMRNRYHYPDDTTDETIREDVLSMGMAITERPAEYLLVDLDEFVLIMSSIGATNQQRAFIHTRLYKSLQRTLRLPMGQFNQTWTQLLDYAYANIKLFSTDRIFRSINDVKITARNQEVYQLLLVLITDTMIPESRYSKSIESMYTLYESLRDVHIEAKLNQFYGY